MSIWTEVRGERERQDELWGEQNHPDGTGPAVSFDGVFRMAEMAAANRLACKAAAGEYAEMSGRGPLTWRHILLEEVFEALSESDPAKLREELVQVAAVTVQWLEAIDRREA